MVEASVLNRFSGGKVLARYVPFRRQPQYCSGGVHRGVIARPEKMVMSSLQVHRVWNEQGFEAPPSI
jgi:hypothetical protein